MAKKKRSFKSANQKNRQRRKTGRKWLDIPAGVNQFKEEAGKRVKMDILPYAVKDVNLHPDKKDIPDDLWWKYPYMVHRGVGPDKEDIICPGTVGKPCYICEERQAIYDDPDGDNDDASDLKASKRGIYAVRTLKGKKGEPSDVMIWDISDYCFLEQLDVELDDAPEEYEDFAAPEGGYTLKIRFIEKKIGKDFSFPMAHRVDFIERDDIEDDYIDEEVPCLDDIITIPSYDTVKALFLGEDDPDDEDDPEPTEKKKKKEKKSEKKEKPAKKEKKKEKEKEEDSGGESEHSWDDLLEMDEDDLVDLAEDLDVDLEEDMDEDDIRKAIAEDQDIDIPKKKKKKDKEKKSDKSDKKEKKSDKKDKEKKSDKKEKKSKKGGKDECPFAYKFGVDFEEHEDCDEDGCKMYEKCFDVYNED